MNRNLRRVMASETRKQAAGWTTQLTPVPRVEWPARKPGWAYPIGVYRSQSYLAQLYEAPPMAGVEARRLSVNRTTMDTGGGWDQSIPWDDLWRCKTESGHADWYGIEIYPRERDLVNVANMRHLWLFAEPLPIGWFEGKEP